MFSHLRSAVGMLVLMTVLTGLVYPLALTGVLQIALPASSNGSLITRNGAVTGSALIGQTFTSDVYFHGRPSAAGQSGYDAAASSGSNLGPLSKKLLDRVTAAVQRVRGGEAGPVPADAVMASGSGLDPDITPEYALFQIARVAKARGVDPAHIEAIVAKAKTSPFLGVIGEPHVNVLLLNMALDEELASRAG
jgi:potassium-transporting ATPase KdpC subunit